MSSKVIVALIVVAFFAVACGACAQARRFDLADLAKIVDVSDPQIAPDGTSIVVVVSRPDYEADRYASELVLVEVATRAQQLLTPGRHRVASPRWSPTGDRLAFLAPPGGDAEFQVFLLPRTGGAARQLTRSPTGVQQFAWRPDGAAIAYVAADTAPNKDAIKQHEDAFEVGHNGYLQDAAPVPAHLWVVPAAGGTARRVTAGSWSLAPGQPLSWSPDGKTIAITRQATPFDGDRDSTVVALIDVATAAVRLLTGRQALEGYPVFSPDGSRIAYRYRRDGDLASENEVYVAPATGGEGRDATRVLDRAMFLMRWWDAQTLLVGGDDGTTVSLWLQPIDGPARKLDLGAVVPVPDNGRWMDVAVGPRGAIAFIGGEAHRPLELYHLASPTAPLHRLTDFNHDIAGLELGAVETIEWRNDGFHEDGVLVYPPGYSATKHYPLVLVIHGALAASRASLGGSAGLGALSQLMATRGWFVFSPNYRSSDNLGAAYMTAMRGATGGEGAGVDVMAGLAAVERRASVDTTRIGVSGWSFGGYMTTWLVGHYHRWSAAVAVGPVTDEADGYNLAAFDTYLRHRFGGSPWDSTAARAYVANSPITYAAQIRTPMLIMADRGDAVVPIVQSYKLFHALRDHGVPVQFVVYPVGGHFPADPVRARDVWRRWIGWFEQSFDQSGAAAP